MNRARIARALDRLERQAEEYAARQLVRQQEEAHKAAERRRWQEIDQRFGELLPDDMWDRVRAALKDRDCPLWSWLDSIHRGRSRLPDCLTQDVMRRLVEMRLCEGAASSSSDFIDGICMRCGLQYPLPGFTSSARCGGACCEDRNRREAERRAKSLALYHRLFGREGCPACGASTKAGEMNWAHLMADGYWFTHMAETVEQTGS
jgi:hypothetical protein